MTTTRGLIIDLFAGGGGASSGIELATGRSPDLAINHSPAAIAMHAANHPRTEHRCESILDVDPVAATGGRPVDLLWASPCCTHFSRARGGTPVSKQLRGLGWQVRRWAGQTRPELIICENVAEWETWGPVRHGRPQASRKGAYFRQLVAALQGMGYSVDYRTLNAADYGAPTSRRRLFLVARRDGAAVVWPRATHGDGLRRVRTAADCIDWSDRGRSIFDRTRPLADATCRRIAAGIVRYVLQGKPFLVEIDNRSNGLRGARAVDAPLSTITTENRHALVTAFIAKHYGGVIGHRADRPLGTITAVDHHSPVTVDLQAVGAATDGTRVAAFMTQYYSSGGQTAAADAPLTTIETKARHGLVTVDIDGQTFALVDIRFRMLRPDELAKAQGFRSTYVLTGTQSEQIARIGNSVCPPVAAAVVRANLAPVRRPLRAAA